MATFYIDPSAPGTGTGSGTLAAPFKSWTSVTWAPGNTYLQKRGTTYRGILRLSTGGTRLGRITLAAYFRNDGSDDPARPKPIIVLPAAPTTPANGASISVFNQERDFVTYRNLDIRNLALPAASDVAIIWLGNDCVFENNNVSSNCGGAYVFGKSRVTVANCRFDVVRHDAAFANHGILVAGSVGIDAVNLSGNTVIHRGGGSRTSYGIRCETYNATTRLTNLLIRDNRVSPPIGERYSRNPNAIGIYLINGTAATLERNTVTGMLSGILAGTGDRNRLANNDCSYNMNFGIHVVGFAKNYIIEGNTCNHNGGIVSDTFYGRGIELSSAAGIGAVSGHIIRNNICRFNYNYGGPVDNGSEGVGIGLDNGTTQCRVYGNHLTNNEGNGIQLYGGGAPGTIPDTGGHTLTGNYLTQNCTFAVMNRRSGGSQPSPFYAHIQLAYIYGSRTLISSNTLGGPPANAIHIGTASSNIVVENNIYLDELMPSEAGIDTDQEAGPDMAGTPVPA